MESKSAEYVAISDIHNDLTSARASLRERGLIEKHSDEWHDDVHDVHIVLTGDLVNREAPDHAVIRLFRHLAEHPKHNNTVTLLLGNHELDLLTTAATGSQRVRLKPKDLAFLETGQIIYKRGPVLFLHAYPTQALLEDMVAQYEEHGGDVPNEAWHINEQCTQACNMLPYAPLESAHIFQELGAYATTTRSQMLERAESDVAQDTATAKLLERLQVKVVVHGHKRRVSGKQAIEKYMPGICMVNNDTAIALTKNPDHEHRIGSTIVRTDGDAVDVVCVHGAHASRPNHVHTVHKKLH
ncbi:MAG: metallophosphoesterase [Candidatus Pacebacteria bacterium]|nr:metallophosphoesterase [Candidatus Paceibacterota bacterium]